MNTDQKSEKKQIIKHVRACIERGEPKQLILEELSHLYKDKVAIVKQLELTPSKAMKYKYRTHNYFLAALLLIALVLNAILLFKLDWGKETIIDIATAANIVLGVVFLVGVLMYRIEIYSWIASSAVVTLITILASLYYYVLRDINPLLFISLTIIVISFIFGLLLSVKLCPPRVPKNIEIDIDGTEKINKTVYVFPD
jgi:membrane-associated HD superfamily phosphohydrolase